MNTVIFRQTSHLAKLNVMPIMIWHTKTRNCKKKMLRPYMQDRASVSEFSAVYYPCCKCEIVGSISMLGDLIIKLLCPCEYCHLHVCDASEWQACQQCEVSIGDPANSKLQFNIHLVWLNVKLVHCGWSKMITRLQQLSRNASMGSTAKFPALFTVVMFLISQWPSNKPDFKILMHA